MNIETGSATKTYDGSALTNATLKVDGLVAGDVVTGRTTGSQTEVGSSANTYTLTWGEVDSANYEITEQLGVLTVEAVWRRLFLARSSPVARLSCLPRRLNPPVLQMSLLTRSGELTKR